MSENPDDFDVEPACRRFLEYYAQEAHTISGVEDHSRAFVELPKLELERMGRNPPSLADHRIQATVDHVVSRRDCADFGLTGLLRMFCRYPGSSLLDDTLQDAIEEAVLGFAYWFDAPGEHETWFCTENHQILFHAAELLAGQLFPDVTFEAEGLTGDEHRTRAERRVRRWLEWRHRFGFSEWLANGYYDEDVAALANLAEFAADKDIRTASERLLSRTLFEIALNSHDGVFGSTHGRAYASDVLDPSREPTSGIQRLLWGEGSRNRLSIGAVSLATSEYEAPKLVREVALAEPDELVVRQRHGLDVEAALRHGIDPDDPDDQLFFWGGLVMGHRDVVDRALEHCPKRYDLRYREIASAARYHAERAGDAGYEPDPNNTALTRADVYTFKTPDYMLSCAQDYRKGKFGFQHHVWQATLGGRALAFTNHPKADGRDASPGQRWGGTGLLPRSVAYLNVAVSLYRVGEAPYATPDIPGFESALAETPYTHAYVPTHAFDEWREANGWVFGRRGDGYLAVTSPQSLRWAEPRADELALMAATDEDPDSALPYELVADDENAAWICECGNSRSHGSFEAFVDAVSEASVDGDANDGVRYQSPSVGRVEVDWEGQPVVDGQPVELDHDALLDSRYLTIEFGSTGAVPWLR